jgi:hypothetical protein
MPQSINNYWMKKADECRDPQLLDEYLKYFLEEGKKAKAYGSGQIVFHHRGSYWFVSPDTGKYAPRHKANQKWYTPKERTPKSVLEGINGWCDFRDSKRAEYAKVDVRH